MKNTNYCENINIDIDIPMQKYLTLDFMTTVNFYAEKRFDSSTL